MARGERNKQRRARIDPFDMASMPQRSASGSSVAILQRSAPLLMLLALVTVALIAYARAIAGGFIWDDDSYILKNETLDAAAGLWRIWFEIGATPQYYPLVFSTFWIENHVWGHWSHGYHTVNVLLHAGTAWMLWRILRRLEIPGAAAAAFIFALHPVHVESVAWITERKNVLSGFFYMLSAMAYLRFSPPTVPDGSADSGRDETAMRPATRSQTPKAPPSIEWRFYAISMLCFVLALLSKTVTATLPAALLLIYWWKSGRVARRNVLALVPMLIIGAAAGQLTAWVETHHVGTKYIDLNFSLAERVLIAGRAVWFYFAKLLWPHPLTFFYYRWKLDPAALWQWAFPLAAILLVIILTVKVRRFGRGPLVAALFFGGTLFPALGFVSVFPMRYSFVADHFQYLASIGPIVLICAGAAIWLRRRKSGVAAGAAICGMACVILGALTFRQGAVYNDLVTLWLDTLEKNPDASMARNNLGTEYQRQGRYDDAIASYEVALAHPDCYDRPDVLSNMAKAWTLKNNYPRAIELYEQAISERPSFPKALNNLGALLQRVGRVNEARERLEASIRANPDDPLAWNNLGSVLLESKRPTEALTHLKKALELRPDFSDAHYNLGNAYWKLRQISASIDAYKAALKLDPGYVDAYVNMANVYLQDGQVEIARTHLATALRLSPQHAIANYHMSSVLVRDGRLQEAAAHFKIAQQGRPDLKPPTGLTAP